MRVPDPEPTVIKTIACERAEDFLDQLLPTQRCTFRRHDDDAAWIFRGHASATWGLVPKAHRMVKHRYGGKDISIAEIMRWIPGQVESPMPQPAEMVEREFQLVINYCIKLGEAGLEIPFDSPEFRYGLWAPPTVESFPPHDHLAMFALAQHYGIPTRLLDWTWKPLFAAYFAAYEVARERCQEGMDSTIENLAVWALNTDLQRWMNIEEPGVHLITAPTVSNPNMHAQGGLFTLIRYATRHPDASKNLPPGLDALLGTKSVSDVPEKHRYLLPALVKLTLPAHEARTLLRLLARYGVTGAHVFPGHKGVADALLEPKFYQVAGPGERS